MSILKDNVITQSLIAKSLADRPLPSIIDGQYEPSQQKEQGLLLNLTTKIGSQLRRGIPTSDRDCLPATVDALIEKLNGLGLDDRQHGFENVIDILAKMDPDSPAVKKVNDAAVTKLYETVPHPPNSFVGASKFREADGGKNNQHLPDLGCARKTYARSVQELTPVPQHDLPDPGLVFDALLKRRYNAFDSENDHKGGHSSVTFAFASLVIHSLFDTSLKHPNVNNASSYLDLSVLYGSCQETLNKLRLKNGTGKIFKDVFGDHRMLSHPPAVAALLVIFSRNHNYIADMLLRINEKKQWREVDQLGDDKHGLEKQDEEIFQTARLINCGHFMAMIFGDYVAGFLGQTRHGQSWHLKAFDPIRREDGSIVGRGEGNHVSIEFNLIYRWHSVISAKDEKWVEQSFSERLGTTDWNNVDQNTLHKAFKDPKSQPPADPRNWTFDNLERQTDGSFRDEDLARILQEATKNPAKRFGARGVPAVMRPIEVLSMIQARNWGAGTMNDFRKFLGLKRLESFEEWNPNPEIANAAHQLYKDIDRLELYPGIHAEECLEITPGSGFACGYTLMRAILADAIALVRGDRFYTTDFTPSNLTAWGYQDCQVNRENGAFGANLPKLLLRHLPNNYSYNSVYALFPFFTPKAMRGNLKSMCIDTQYDFSKPHTVPPIKVIETMKAIRRVMSDHENFHGLYNRELRFCTREIGFFLGSEDKGSHDRDRAFAMHALYPTPASLDEIAEFYRSTTIKLIERYSFRYDVDKDSVSHGKHVDIVRNVINLVVVRWGTEYLSGISLKTEENPNGVFNEQEVWVFFQVLFMYVFENASPENGFFLESKAKQISDIVNGCIERSLRQAAPGLTSVINKAANYITGSSIVDKPCYPFLSRLMASGRDIKELTAFVMGLMIGSTANYAQALANVVNFYLDDARKVERERIVELVSKYDSQSTELLLGYIKEAQRLVPQFPRILRTSVASSEIVVEQGSGKGSVIIHPGDIVWASFEKAFKNPGEFPDPEKVDPCRNRSYWPDVQVPGFHGCPGVKHVEKTFVEIFRVIFGLKNLRRAPGAQGHLASFSIEQFGTRVPLFMDEKGTFSPHAGSLMVVFDD